MSEQQVSLYFPWWLPFALARSDFHTFEVSNACLGKKESASLLSLFICGKETKEAKQNKNKNQSAVYLSLSKVHSTFLSQKIKTKVFSVCACVVCCAVCVVCVCRWWLIVTGEWIGLTSLSLKHSIFSFMSKKPFHPFFSLARKRIQRQRQRGFNAFHLTPEIFIFGSKLNSTPPLPLPPFVVANIHHNFISKLKHSPKFKLFTHNHKATQLQTSPDLDPIYNVCNHTVSR